MSDWYAQPTGGSRELLMKIAMDRRNEMKDRFNASRIHSRICGYRLTGADIKR